MEHIDIKQITIKQIKHRGQKPECDNYKAP